MKVDKPLIGEITGDYIICEGNASVLDASSFSATTYIWNDGSNGSRISVTPEATTLYSVEMKRGECSSEAEFEVVVNTKPVIISVDSIGLRTRLIVTDDTKGTQPF